MRPQRYRSAMTGFRRSSSLAVALIAAGALAGCSSDSGSDAPSTAAAPVSASASAPAQPAAAIPANVPGTYANGDWVVRLAADGTWEEDLRGQVNAYGGTYTVSGDQWCSATAAGRVRPPPCRATSCVCPRSPSRAGRRVPLSAIPLDTPARPE